MPHLAGAARKKVGILWSRRADIDADFEIVVFDADLLGSTRHETMSLVRFRELYRRGAEYLVYEHSIHRGDWAEGAVASRTSTGVPLSLDDVQQDFPDLAAECNLPRVRRI